MKLTVDGAGDALAFVLVMAAKAVSALMPTPVGCMQVEGQSGMVVGALKTSATPLSSTIVTLLLPLFATTAKPNRGRTPMPSGFDPTDTGEPGEIGAPVSRLIIDTVLSA